uniref:Mei2-like C-terminal RNA recognition motif domain-containing protein n=1 Tax=Alexandrium monilatum TaxID=311494 RepID=A0A7S4UFA6_9DINO
MPCASAMRAAKSPDEIELTPVLSGAQLGPQFSPDEPAKVHVAGVRGSYKAEDAREARRDVEKECLYLENAALREVLLQQQQQQRLNWLWQSPSEWERAGSPWAAQACWQPGTEVIFQGLKSAVDLNGHHAVVERWDEASGRWVVQLPTGEEKFAKPENLVAAYPPWPEFCAGMQPFAWQSYGDCFDPAQFAAGRSRKGSGALAGAKKAVSPASSFVSDTTARPMTSSFSSCGSWEGDETKTTVMMRNIPNDYTREMLLKLLDKEGFQGSYDLIYLPIDYHSKVGFGYAFINLVSHSEAERFRTHFTDFAKWDVVSQKVCEVCWSSVLQGVQAKEGGAPAWDGILGPVQADGTH